MLSLILLISNFLDNGKCISSSGKKLTHRLRLNNKQISGTLDIPPLLGTCFLTLAKNNFIYSIRCRYRFI